MLVDVGTGNGVGAGGGGGKNAACAWACDAPATNTTKTMATAAASRRAIPVSIAREDRGAQRINAIPKRQSDRNAGPCQSKYLLAQIVVSQGRFAPTSQGASIAHGRRAAAITGHCCSAATGGGARFHRQPDFPSPISLARFPSRARSLLTRKFRVAIPGTIGFRPFDCAFRD